MLSWIATATYKIVRALTAQVAERAFEDGINDARIKIESRLKMHAAETLATLEAERLEPAIVLPVEDAPKKGKK